MGKTIEARAEENGRVEELDTDGGDDTDTPGVGPSRRNTRFVSDSLQFTGIDLGDRASGTVRRRRYGDSDDDDDDGSTSSDDDDNDSAYGEGAAPLAIRDREEALVQSALHRISRARAKGKADVKLSKEELAALERRRKRIQEEEERKKRGSGSGSDRKKKKEQRIAVPLSHLEPVSRKKRTAAQAHPPRQDSLPRHASAGGVLEGQQRQGYPPMGYFPPPSASRSRPRSGTASSRPPSRARDERGSSPFQYEYVPHPSAANRHVSDSVARLRSSRGSPRDEASSSLGSRANLDPFMYQTEGPRAAYPAGAAAASRRHVSGPAEMAYNTHRGTQAPAVSRSHQGSRRQSYGDETSEDEGVTSEESTSDDRGNGAQIGEPAREPAREPVREPVREPSGRGRDVGIVVEVSPERRPEPPKKKSSSPVKKKPVSGSRRKKK
ncbi:Prenylated Rab acceptor 1 [Tolypocladium paradoxum]|uniref:Prenylated Rab acceptor 1 n=1 Tax=Tolypocladium paradoxum TaxID=94208 RepID=A0A2S4KPK2_9HYPO|nr:Prenylated Rab acceptor 1 [Tolypocladium paradoxum]